MVLKSKLLLANPRQLRSQERRSIARVDVRVENGRHWVFGVNDGTAVLVMVCNEIGKRVDADLPSWIEPVVQRTGLEGIKE